MRHLITGIVTGILLALPAAAQQASNPTPAASQTQPAKDSKPADQTAKPGQTSQTVAAPAPKDDSIAKYDATGSNASDALEPVASYLAMESSLGAGAATVCEVCAGFAV